MTRRSSFRSQTSTLRRNHPADVARYLSSTDEGCAPCQQRASQVVDNPDNLADGTRQNKVTLTTMDAGSSVEEMAKTASWEGIIGVEGELTGDGRFIQPEALRWDDLPIPMRYVSADVGAHQGAVVVGRINEIERLSVEEANKRLEELGRPQITDTQGKPILIWARGDMDLGSEIGAEATRQMRENLMNGVSMDLDDVSFEVRVAAETAQMMTVGATDADADPEPAELAMEPDEDGRVKVQEMAPDDEVMVTTSARVRAATIVAVPAFARAKVALTASGVEEIEEIEVPQDTSISPETFDDDPDTNWVEETGGLPKYIRDIADALMGRGYSESRAIATAVNTVKRWARGGTVRANGGPRVGKATQTKAAAAVAEWEAKKAAAKNLAAATQVLATEAPTEDPREMLEDALAAVELASAIPHTDPMYRQLVERADENLKGFQSSLDELPQDEVEAVQNLMLRLEEFLMYSWETLEEEETDLTAPSDSDIEQDA